MTNQTQPNQIKRIYALLGKLNLKHRKEDMVLGATKGRTKSTRAMSEMEADALIDSLDKLAKQKLQPSTATHSPSKSDILDRKRKRVIAQMCQAGYITKSGRADMPRIEEWVMKQKHKTAFNALTSQQLSELITAAEGVARHFYGTR